MTNSRNSQNSDSTFGNSNNRFPSSDPEAQKQFADLAPGYLLGEHKNYRLEKKLGEGGMGQTWLTVKVSGGRDLQKVVCKLLLKKLLQDEKAMREVERVFRLTQGLYHLHICPHLGIESDPKFGTFLVMAHAEGETLQDWFLAQNGHENGLALSAVLPILRPVAGALDAIHEEGIFHRDVKPGNIVFRKPGEITHPWLIDFGIAARIHTEGMGPTTGHSTSNSGTKEFMAPEQHFSKPQDGRTDQYALAVLTYFLITGSFPFPGQNREECAALKMLLPPQHTLSAPLYAVFSKALSPEMSKRFASCGEFIKMLEEQERLEQERQEQERQERERQERERQEKEQRERERQERERQEKEQRERERQERERQEKEQRKRERQERERQKRLQRERLEQERLEKALREHEKRERLSNYQTNDPDPKNEKKEKVYNPFGMSIIVWVIGGFMIFQSGYYYRSGDIVGTALPIFSGLIGGILIIGGIREVILEILKWRKYTKEEKENTILDLWVAGIGVIISLLSCLLAWLVPYQFIRGVAAIIIIFTVLVISGAEFEDP